MAVRVVPHLRTKKGKHDEMSHDKRTLHPLLSPVMFLSSFGVQIHLVLLAPGHSVLDGKDGRSSVSRPTGIVRLIIVPLTRALSLAAHG